jgi:hypothetical protein
MGAKPATRPSWQLKEGAHNSFLQTRYDDRDWGGTSRAIVMLEHVGTKPAYVVAGSLYAGDMRIFGEDVEFDGKARFSETNMSWDGHAWIVYGDWLADVSLFRTADSDKSSPALKEHVKRQFGHGKGLYACKLGSEVEHGFR